MLTSEEKRVALRELGWALEQQFNYKQEGQVCSQGEDWIHRGDGSCPTRIQRRSWREAYAEGRVAAIVEFFEVALAQLPVPAKEA